MIPSGRARASNTPTTPNTAPFAADGRAHMRSAANINPSSRKANSGVSMPETA